MSTTPEEYQIISLNVLEVVADVMINQKPIICLEDLMHRLSEYYDNKVYRG